MIENSVVMEFKDQIGKAQSITVRDVMDDVPDYSIKAAMDAVVNTCSIVGAGGAYVEIVSAEKIFKDTQKVSL